MMSDRFDDTNWQLIKKTAFNLFINRAANDLLILTLKTKLFYNKQKDAFPSLSMADANLKVSKSLHYRYLTF